nr:uncharacterized protein LOC127312431 isoform X1 [Lolium perenne]
MLGGSLRRLVAALAVALAVLAVSAAAAAAVDRSFHRDFDAVWGKRNARFLEQGRVVELSLDERTGSRLESKDRYLFGRFDLDIRLVAGESAGTITSFYMNAADLHWRREARRGGLRVPGQRERRALPPAHQHLQRRQGRARAAVRALVRPHCRLPHLLHPLEPAQHHPVHRRHADQGVQEQRGERGAVPDAAAGTRLREHLERRGVGDAGRARQDELVGGAVRGRVPAVPREQRVRVARQRSNDAVRGRPPAIVGVVVDGTDAGLVELDDAQLGAHELHGLRLLRRPEAVSPCLPHRVHHSHRQNMIISIS